MKNRRRAFTIVEIMVCAALVAVVFAAVNSGLFTGRKAAEKGLNYLDRLGKINRLLEHCKRAVRFATKITPSNGPGNSRLYQIKYIERVKAPGLTRIENEMKIKAKPVKNGTTVIVKYKDKKTTYQLKDLEFFMELDKNLATIALSPTKGKRPPIALSLFAPFLNQVSLPPMMGVTGAGVPPLTATNSTSGNNSTTPPITSSGNMDGVIEPANANDGTDKSHSEDDNPGDMLGQSSVFGGSNNQSSTTVDGVDVSNIQFTSVSTTFNPTSRSGTRSGSNRPGNPSHETSDVQVNTMSTSATPPANDEILGMDG